MGLLDTSQQLLCASQDAMTSRRCSENGLCFSRCLMRWSSESLSCRRGSVAGGSQPLLARQGSTASTAYWDQIMQRHALRSHHETIVLRLFLLPIAFGMLSLGTKYFLTRNHSTRTLALIVPGNENKISCHRWDPPFVAGTSAHKHCALAENLRTLG